MSAVDPLADLLDQVPAETSPAAPRLATAEERHALATLQRGGFDVQVVEVSTDHRGGRGVSCDRVIVDEATAPATLDVYIPRPEDDHEPPSMLAELGALLRDYDQARPRSLQKRPGPSELGTPCGRQLAYKIAEYKGADIRRYDTGEIKWAPMQGTMIHELMERVLAFGNDRHTGDHADLWDVEAEAHIDDNIRGSSDAFRRVTVVDWKYTGTTQLKKLRAAKRAGKPPREQISQEYRIQTHLYGYARELKGLPVKWVRIVFLARSWQFDDSDEWTERYDPRIAIWAIDRYYQLDELVDELRLLDHPERWHEVPAAPSEDACHWCPFRRPGGPADDTGCPGNTAEVEASSRERFERSIGA